MKSCVCFSLLVITGCATKAPAPKAEAPEMSAGGTSGPVKHAEAPFQAQYDLATGQFIGAPTVGMKIHSDGMVDGTPATAHAAPTRASQAPTYVPTQAQTNRAQGPTYRVKSGSAKSAPATRATTGSGASDPTKAPRDE